MLEQGLRRVLAGYAALIVAAHAWAAPPMPFDNWTANPDGTLTAPCPAGYACVVNVTGEGILQRLITAPDGRSYIQLVVYSPTPNGELREESFVRADNALENGLSSRQVLTSNGSVGENLTSIVLINTGWAMDPGQAAVQIEQTLVDITPEGTQFDQIFQKLIDHDANGLAIGYYMNIRQDLINSTLMNGVSLGPSDQDIHSFVLRQVQGTRNPVAGSATLPGGGMMGGGMMGGGVTGGTISWVPGDEVKVIWIGQICTGACRQGGGMMGGGGMGGMGMMGGGLFAYQAYDNLSDTAPQINSLSLFSTDPIIWQDPPFGPQPSL